jgi:hypothetical protein
MAALARRLMRPAVITLISTAVLTAGCGSTSKTGTPTKPGGALTQKLPCKVDPHCPKPIHQITKDNLALLENDPAAFKGAQISIVGRVYNVRAYPEKKFMLDAAPASSNLNSVMDVYTPPGTRVREGEYVRVVGIVLGNEAGESAVGAGNSLPLIDANVVRRSSAR